MCGAHTASQGSPPRMRGKGNSWTGFFRRPGITPAYAGKRNIPFSFQQPYQDHPRVCGEKHVVPVLTFVPQGSPPRMRGKVEYLMPEVDDMGITPAYAGKSLPFGGHSLRTGDHPRVCGEKRFFTFGLMHMRGSPPRMRGKDVPWSYNQGLGGITPAYAGKSGISPGILLSYRDHPRVCGEKVNLLHFLLLLLGSPPRMRGKAVAASYVVHGFGITPAYAGKRRL